MTHKLPKPQRIKKENWMRRLQQIINVKKEYTPDKPGHCGNYASKACLTCGKCWDSSPKKI